MGRSPIPNAQEYYLGPISAGQSTSGDIIGAVGGTLPSLTWYKYVSDGSTPIVFDMFGSVFGFGGGGVFTGGPDGELALYDVNGHYVAGNESVPAPANGESNIPPTVPSGAPPAPVNYRQPRDPTRPVYEYSTSQNTWFAPTTRAFRSSRSCRPRKGIRFRTTRTGTSMRFSRQGRISLR